MNWPQTAKFQLITCLAGTTNCLQMLFGEGGEWMLVTDMNLDQYLKILESDEAVRDDSVAFSTTSGTNQVMSTVQAMQRHNRQSGAGEMRRNGRHSAGSTMQKSSTT